MKVIVNKSEIKKCHNNLIKQLKKFESEKILASSGYQGVNYKVKVSYSEELDIWWDMGDISNGRANPPRPRYFNAFGKGKPTPNKDADIICEINYPVQGINKSVAACWAQDGKDILLIHSGRIGGGRAGIGKTAFTEYYAGTFMQAGLPELPDEVTVIGRLGDQSLGYQIKNFIDEVARIKALIVDQKASTSAMAAHSFNEEFVGIKEYQQKRAKISATVNHGLIVNTLKDILSKNYAVGNDQQRDLYTYSASGKVEKVFEIKTSLSSQSIFTAIGQLYVNNIRIKPLPQLIYVIPEKPNANMMKTLKKLQIEVLVYSLKSGKVQFTNISKIL